MRLTIKLFIGLATLLLLLTACGSKQARTQAGQQAQLLKITHGDGYTLATISDPWHNGQTLHTYVLVPRSQPMPQHVPQGTVVRTPITNALVYSEVHTSLMRELGRFDAVGGVCDAQYFTDPQVQGLVRQGRIADCGNSQAPNVERVIALKPDAILLSPYQDATYGQIEKLGIPIIECADYLEYTPLGRAEWVRFYGALLGRERQADSLYEAVQARYNAVLEKTRTVQSRPVVITEMVISGVWNVPGGQSYMARVIADAGGSYPWSDDKSTGSLSLDFNQVLARAQNADFWFLKWTGINSLADLKAQYALNASFKAYKQKRVWACDTELSHFFVRIPFHPDLLLEEYASVLHPDLFPGYKHQFYHQLQ